jgi:hypothetical protein
MNINSKHQLLTINKLCPNITAQKATTLSHLRCVFDRPIPQSECFLSFDTGAAGGL